MNKQERLKLIKEMAYKRNHEILSGTHDDPTHIRIDELCDIWSNGTLKIHGKKGFIKGEKGFQRFAQLMNDGVTPESIKLSMRQEIDNLKHLNIKQGEKIKGLNVALHNVYERLEELEFLVNAPASVKSV